MARRSGDPIRVIEQKKPQACGIRVPAGHGYLLPCPYVRPCPIHGRRRAESPREDVSPNKETAVSE